MQGLLLIVLLAAIAGAAWRGLNHVDEGFSRWTTVTLALIAATLLAAALRLTPGAGGLSGPRGMDFLPSGHLLVASYQTDQVLEYDASGSFVREFTDEFGITGPWGVRVGPNGDVYIAISYGSTGRIVEYFPVLGKYYRSFVRGATELIDPTGIDFMPASPDDVNGNRVIDACEAGDLDSDGVDNVVDKHLSHHVLSRGVISFRIAIDPSPNLGTTG